MRRPTPRPKSLTEWIVCADKLALRVTLLFLLYQTPAFAATGEASFYSVEQCRFNSDPACPTASGDSLYALEARGVLFAAMWGVRLGQSVRVTNTANGKSVVVRILDRGPNRRFPSRVIDLNRLAFSKIADPADGVINVTVTSLDRGTTTQGGNGK